MESSNLSHFIRIIRARRWLVVVPVIVLTATTVVVSVLQPSTYQGEVTVLVTQQNTGTTLLGAPQTGQSQPANFVATQVKVMQSSTIAERAIRALGLSTTPTELGKRVVVSEDADTNIVTIAVTDTSATRAADTANALAQAYVTWSQDLERASIKAAADDVQQRLALAQRDIVSIEATLAARGSTDAAQVRLQAAKDLYTGLADKLEQLREYQQLETGSGSVLAAAAADPRRVSPIPVRDGALAVAVGLMLGFGSALLVETLDDTVKSADEAEEIYGAPVLANVPTEKSRKGDAPRLTLIENPGGSGAEAYRVLRNNLGFINFERNIKVVLVSSASPDEGKSTVAANLAVVLSTVGKKVALVACDFHRPAAAQFFDVDQAVGLSGFLAGMGDLQTVLQQPTGLENLWVLPAGSLPPNPSELLSSPTMGQLVAGLRESVDWVILDSAPLLAVADAAAAARWVDGVLIVSRAGLTTRDAARKSRTQLENVGARILGIVLRSSEQATTGGDGYFKGYGASSAK